MIVLQNSYGNIEITDKYLSHLLGQVVSSSFGVVGMNVSGPVQGLRRFVSSDRFIDEGVKIRKHGDKLWIDLHIIVSYGVNIKTIVESIIGQASFAIEQATGIIVGGVLVHVDKIVD